MYQKKVFFKKKFEQYILREVPGVHFSSESEQGNPVCSRDSECGIFIENVSKSRISLHTPMGPIICKQFSDARTRSENNLLYGEPFVREYTDIFIFI